jgi:Ulp1 family protease
MKQFTENTLKKSPYFDAIKYFVTNFDLESAFPNCKIVKYADLDQFQHIYDLLPNKMDFYFILTESKYNQGHRTALIRNNNKFEYFDSYSDSPKSILDFIPKYMNKQLGNNWSQDLGKIISSIKKQDKFLYNKVPLQQEMENVNTCGRWCILRVATFLKEGLDNKQFLSYIKKQQRKVKRPFDEVITMLV